METTQTSGFDGIPVENFRTDVLIEMMHSLYKQLWKINDDLDLIQGELDRREQPIGE